MRPFLCKIFSVISAMLPLCAVAADTASSPNGRLQLSVDVNDNGQPCYGLTLDGNPVIKNSLLGLSGREADFTTGFTVRNVATATHDGTWEPVWGEYATVRDHYNELAVTFVQERENGLTMTVRFRLFDDGLGFRYELPEQEPVNYLAVMDEATEFNLAADNTLYCMPGDYDTDSIEWGKVQKLAGQMAIDWIMKSIELGMAGKIDAVSTSPIHKGAIKLIGVKEPGQCRSKWIRQATDFRLISPLTATAWLHSCNCRSTRRGAPSSLPIMPATFLHRNLSTILTNRAK